MYIFFHRTQACPNYMQFTCKLGRQDFVIVFSYLLLSFLQHSLAYSGYLMKGFKSI